MQVAKNSIRFLLLFNIVGYHKSTSVLSQMLPSDWLCNLLSVP